MVLPQRRRPRADWQMCHAMSSRTGKPCGRQATPGATVCASHGSSAPKVKKAAGKRITNLELIDKLASWNVPIVTTPQEALLSTLYAVAGRVHWLKQRIAAFTPGHGFVVEVADIADNVTKPVNHGFDNGFDTVGDPALLFVEREQTEFGERVTITLNPLLVMLRAEEKHLVDVARECHKAGIEQQKVDLHTLVAELLTGILGRALPELGVTATPERVIDVISHAMLAA